jgi:folate-binding Fe-S cluster repair protein YgfZ
MQSNDLAAAPFGGAIAAAFLGGKGRLVAVGLLWRRRDEVIVTTDPERLTPLREHLDKLLIMEDCELQGGPGLRRLRYWPSDSPPRAVPEHILGSAQPLGFELLLAEAEAQSLLETLRDRPRPDLAEAFRVAAGVPRWAADLDEDTTRIRWARPTLVQQGVLRRTGSGGHGDYRGRVAWNLVRLEVPGQAPRVGARIGAGGKGRVTSATQVGGIALLLGYVHKEQIVPGSEVPLEDGRTARVLGLPYGSLPGAGVCT